MHSSSIQAAPAISVTSLEVAEYFEKHHRDVLRAIRNLECPSEFRQRNYAPSSYVNRQGKHQPCYKIAKEGFSLLALGFIGKKAMARKIPLTGAADWSASVISEILAGRTASTASPSTQGEKP